MLNLRGLRYGNFGLWDPRSDTTVFHMNEIKKFEKKHSIPEFFEFVENHESIHRMLYNLPTIMDIASSGYMAQLFPWENAKRLNAKDWQVLIHILTRTNDLLDDVGYILDAYYALFLLHMRFLKIKLAEEKIGRIVASNLAYKKSERAFEELLKLYKQPGATFRLLRFVVRQSLQVDSMPVKKSFSKGSMSSTKMFYGLIKSLLLLSKNSSAHLKEVVNEIEKFDNASQKQALNYQITILDELKKYNPKINYERHTVSERNRKVFHSSFANAHLKKNFFNDNESQLLQTRSILTVIEENNKYSNSYYKKAGGPNKFLRSLHNLFWSSVNDSIWSKKPVTCILCELGFCQEKEIREEAHKNLNNVKKNLPLFYKYF